MFVDASCSIVPQLATGSGKPRPTYDSVASATMNAGTRSVICTATKPRVAGSRCRSSRRVAVAPSASAASAYSSRRSVRTMDRTPCAEHQPAEHVASEAVGAGEQQRRGVVLGGDQMTARKPDEWHASRAIRFVALFELADEPPTIDERRVPRAAVVDDVRHRRR